MSTGMALALFGLLELVLISSVAAVFYYRKAQQNPTPKETAPEPPANIVFSNTPGAEQALKKTKPEDTLRDALQQTIELCRKRLLLGDKRERRVLKLRIDLLEFEQAHANEMNPDETYWQSLNQHYLASLEAETQSENLLGKDLAPLKEFREINQTELDKINSILQAQNESLQALRQAFPEVNGDTQDLGKELENLDISHAQMLIHLDNLQVALEENPNAEQQNDATHTVITAQSSPLADDQDDILEEELSSTLRSSLARDRETCCQQANPIVQAHENGIDNDGNKELDDLPQVILAPAEQEPDVSNNDIPVLNQTYNPENPEQDSMEEEQIDMIFPIEPHNDELQDADIPSIVMNPGELDQMVEQTLGESKFVSSKALEA